MLEFNPQPNYQGPTTTASSAIEGRLKVGTANRKKKAIIKKKLRKQ